jgi:hypothetical protein
LGMASCNRWNILSPLAPTMISLDLRSRDGSFSRLTLIECGWHPVFGLMETQ